MVCGVHGTAMAECTLQMLFLQAVERLLQLACAIIERNLAEAPESPQPYSDLLKLFTSAVLDISTPAVHLLAVLLCRSVNRGSKCALLRVLNA